MASDRCSLRVDSEMARLFIIGEYLYGEIIRVQSGDETGDLKVYLEEKVSDWQSAGRGFDTLPQLHWMDKYQGFQALVLFFAEIRKANQKN